MPTVFISYSQKDKEIADKVRATLKANDIKVTIDSDAMVAGENIRDFIDRAIRDTEVTLSIVSRNSLSSDWVALESVESFAAEKFLKGKKFIACYLDDGFYTDDGFLRKTLKSIQKQIDKLNIEITKLNEMGADSVHLQTKRTRKINLKNNLPNILAKLNDYLTLDIRESAYEASLQRIIKEIRGSDDPSSRQKEIDYLNLLRDEELKSLNTYTKLGGQVTERPIIKAVYEHKVGERLNLRDRISKPVETRRFEDAVGEILQLKRAVVLGEPGAGKTTTLWKLAGDLIPKALASPAERLPILIRLGKWTDESMPLMTFLSGQLGELGGELERLLAENRTVLLLDGLNELPAGQRKSKTAEIRQLITKWPNLTTIISCRLLDYDQNELDYDRVEIVPLDPMRIKQFVCGYLGQEKGEKLFWRLAGKKARETYDRFKQEFTGKIPEMDKVFWCDQELRNGITWGLFNNHYWDRWIRDREHPSSLMVLAKNPFMLMMLYSVYDEKTDTLPENRGQLFEVFAETLFEREKVKDEDQEPLKIGIARVAYEMQTRRTSQEEGDALTVLPRSEVAKLLDERLIGIATRARVVQFWRLLLTASDERLIGIATRASILSPGEEIRFTHQLLQEYFAARYMDTEIKAGRLVASKLWPAEKWWKRNNWEEATILLAGLYNDDCTEVINWIADANPEVAAACIQRSGSVCPPGTMEDLKRRWLPRLTDLKQDPEPRARAAVGRALGMTGLDDRPGVGTKVDQNGIVLPDIDWVRIPAGEFIYGDPGEKLKLGQFEISRYPVTYKQFQVFINDPEGIGDKRWFAGLTDDENEQQPGEQAFQFDNHPRDSVSWYQAVAFCRWFSWRLGGEYALDRIDQWKARLPTEYEWERAARGSNGRIYPYGNEFDASKANTYETGINQTSAVGIFPHGSSPDGVLDMSGNVCQWCQSSYEHGRGRDMAASRVFRGGRWLNYGAVRCRSAYRDGHAPGYRNYDVGFRLSRTLPLALLPLRSD